MTPTETVTLVAYVHACCPHQALDEFTPDVWHDLLGDLGLAECRAAVVAVAKRQPFVAASEIRAEVRRERDRQHAIEQTEQLVAPVRRRQLRDPRPLREQIEAIFAEYGRRELLPAGPPRTDAPDKPRNQQLDELEALAATSHPRPGGNT